MKTLHFSTLIHAPRQRVWEVMLGLETFKRWANEFVEGAYFEGAWDQGEKIRFLTPDGSGLTSMIAENRPYAFISIKHLGYIKDWVEDTESDSVRAWAPAGENYTFADVDGSTELRVDTDVTPDFEVYMGGSWPKALAKLKALCEAGA